MAHSLSHVAVHKVQDLLKMFQGDTGYADCTLLSDSLLCVAVQEVQDLLKMLQGDLDTNKIVRQTLADLPSLTRQVVLGWSERVLAS